MIAPQLMENLWKFQKRLIMQIYPCLLEDHWVMIGSIFINYSSPWLFWVMDWITMSLDPCRSYSTTVLWYDRSSIQRKVLIVDKTNKRNNLPTLTVTRSMHFTIFLCLVALLSTLDAIYNNLIYIARFISSFIQTLTEVCFKSENYDPLP